MKTVMLIGGSGFLGTRLTSAFLDRGYRVVIVSRGSLKKSSQRIIHIKSNLIDKETITSAVSNYKIDEVLFLANTIPPNAVTGKVNEHIEIHCSLLESLYQVVERITFFSSGGRVYGNGHRPHLESDELNPACEYGLLKKHIEERIRLIADRYSKKYLIVRPSNPFGFGQPLNGTQGVIARMLGCVLTGKAFELWGSGREIRDFIFIDDFIDIFFNIFNLSDDIYFIYNIGSGVGVNVRDLIKIVSSLDQGEDLIINRICLDSNVNVSVFKNVLDMSRYEDVFGYKYRYTPLEVGIRKFYTDLLKQP